MDCVTPRGEREAGSTRARCAHWCACGVRAAWGVLEQHAAVRVHVGVGVLGLAVLRQHARHDLVDGVDQLEELVIRHVLERKLALQPGRTHAWVQGERRTRATPSHGTGKAGRTCDV